MKKAEILAAMSATASPPLRAINIAPWGVVHVRDALSGEVDLRGGDVAQKLADEAGMSVDNAKLIRGLAQVMCDEDGERLFDPDSVEDLQTLGRQPWRLLAQALVSEFDTPGN